MNTIRFGNEVSSTYYLNPYSIGKSDAYAEAAQLALSTTFRTREKI